MTSAVRPSDENANFITHGAGLLLSVAATVYLMQCVSDRSLLTIAACGLFSLTLLLTYGSSTLSHAFHDLSWRQRFRTLDQASIFLLIAGTYTPFAVIFLNRGGWLWLLAVMWLAAGAGVLRVLQVRDLSGTDKLAYGLFGCLPVVAFGELARLAPPSVRVWIVVGGVCYGIGAVFLSLSNKVRYAHAVWHLLVVAGTACHFVALMIALSAT
jgi:hemolysin III